MKKGVLIFCFIIVVASCSKSNQQPATIEITGKWELRQVFGGFSGDSDLFSPGNGRLFIYGADNSFVSYQKDTIISKGTYQIKKGSITFNQHQYDGIYYNQSTKPTIIQIKADTLFLIAPFADGDGFKYVKIN